MVQDEQPLLQSCQNSHLSSWIHTYALGTVPRPSTFRPPTMAPKSIKHKKPSYESVGSSDDSGEYVDVSAASRPLVFQKRRPQSSSKTHVHPSDVEVVKTWKKQPYERLGTWSDDPSDSSDSGISVHAPNLVVRQRWHTFKLLIQSLTKPFVNCFSFVTTYLPSHRRNLDEREAERRRRRRRVRKPLIKLATSPTKKSTNPGPKFDNFYTPANKEFYGLRPYAVLEPHQFRLLKILSCEDDGLLSCEMMENVDIRRIHGRYLAISYYAGNPHETISILVDGHAFNAFATLAHGITNIYRFWTKERPGQDLLLWADQICINQSNLQERSYQVGLMRNIYQWAEMTLVSLCDARGVGPSLEWFIKLDTELRCADQSPYKHVATDGSTSPALDSKCLLELLRHRVDQGLDLTRWRDAYDIMAHPWWTRAWVFQEFIVSSKSYFCNATGSLSWLSILPILSTLCSLSAADVENLYKPDLHPEGKLISEAQQERLTSTPSFDTAEFEFQEFFHKLLKRIGEAEADKRAVRSIVESKHKFSDLTDLKIILRHARNCQATDTRDLVYAFLGLADPRYGIFADYNPSNTIEDVLIKTATRIIVFENSLDILSDAVGPRGQFAAKCPTWVPDWTSRETEQTPKISPNQTPIAEYSASKGTECHFAIAYDQPGYLQAIGELKNRDGAKAARSNTEAFSTNTEPSASTETPTTASSSSAAKSQNPSAPPSTSPNLVSPDQANIVPPVVVTNVSASTTSEITPSSSAESSADPSKVPGSPPSISPSKVEISASGSSEQATLLAEQISKEVSKQVSQRFQQRQQQQLQPGQFGPRQVIQQQNGSCPPHINFIISPLRLPMLSQHNPPQPQQYFTQSRQNPVTVQQMPMQQMPMQQMPMQQMPMQQMPMQQIPFHQMPMHQMPVPQMPGSFQQKPMQQQQQRQQQRQQPLKPIPYQQIPAALRRGPMSHPSNSSSSPQSTSPWPQQPNFPAIPHNFNSMPPFLPKVPDSDLYSMPKPPPASILVVRATFVDTLTTVIRDSYGTSKDFRTSKGYSIHATSLARKMDTVFIIHGAKMPFVLRNQGMHFILVSEAIVKVGEDSSDSIFTDMFPGGLTETKNFLYISLI
jgi:hypothetical protein